MSRIVEIQDLGYTYLSASPYEHEALKNINLSLDQGECLGIFGSNGSGKSTLAKILNGLLRPMAGKAVICGIDSSDKRLSAALWKKVGYVFQYPEKQLFNAKVFDEIAFGPRNLGLNDEEVKSRVYYALEQVGLTPDLNGHLSPFNLSGGTRRKVAIAGILALKPDILIFDEPLAGLDSTGQRLVLDIIKNRKENKDTTIIISHDFKEIVDLLDRIAILEQGTLIFNGKVEDLLADTKILAQTKFDLPDYMQAICALAAKGINIDTRIKTMTEVASEISRIFRKNPHWLSPRQIQMIEKNGA